jgi:hypothetical protein
VDFIEEYYIFTENFYDYTQLSLAVADRPAGEISLKAR